MSTVINQQTDDRPKIEGVADIVFAIDVTGSMQPFLEGVKENVKVFVDNLGSATGGQQQPLDWRARVLPFRDINVDADPLNNTFPFVNTADELKKQITPLLATGGDDAPESNLDAIYVAATKSDWRPKGEARRFIVLVSDTSPHELMHESTVEPGEARDVERVIEVLAINEIVLYLFTPDDPLYDRLSMYSGCEQESVDLGTGLKEQDFAKLMAHIAITLSIASVDGAAKPA